MTGVQTCALPIWEDKIEKKARLEELEPMEIAQYYTERYHDSMRLLNVQSPSIEPRASGHIIEQIELVKKILDNGFAYISNGSVYFDVDAYNRKFRYGILSGRTLDETVENTRTLDGQEDKHNPYDFALWKKASPEHIMKWPSPWSVGFPGWHLECSTMSEKYLGEEFDIHGGGMDLLFPHHECELAQNCASRGEGGVRYWMHNNMVTINGKKMGKSLGNFITLDELFHGTHKILTQAYSPMTIRFFILQAHYRSTLDFSNEALQAAEKGMKKMMQAARDVMKLEPSAKAPKTTEAAALKEKIYDALCDDMNTPIAIAWLFDAVTLVNKAKERQTELCTEEVDTLKFLFDDILCGVLGMKDEEGGGESQQKLVDGLIGMIVEERKIAKENRQWDVSDKIRNELKGLGVQLKDTADGCEWTVGN